MLLDMGHIQECITMKIMASSPMPSHSIATGIKAMPGIRSNMQTIILYTAAIFSLMEKRLDNMKARKTPIHRPETRSLRECSAMAGSPLFVKASTIAFPMVGIEGKSILGHIFILQRSCHKSRAAIIKASWDKSFLFMQKSVSLYAFIY